MLFSVILKNYLLCLCKWIQRFGSGSVPTHFIGASLLRGEWKTAVSMILDPREGDILLMFLHASEENSF